MPERWRSGAARQLAQAVRKAGGTFERAAEGWFKITGPQGAITFQEPACDTCREAWDAQMCRDSTVRKIEDATGLKLSEEK